MSCEDDYPEVWEVHNKLCTENNRLESKLDIARATLEETKVTLKVCRGEVNLFREVYSGLLDKILDKVGDKNYD